MSGTWQEVGLGELIQVKHGFAFKGEFFCDERRSAVLLTPGNFAIGGGFKADKLKYYDGPIPDGYVLAAGDLVLTMTDLSKTGDTLGYPALVPSWPGTMFLHNQRLGLVHVRERTLLDKAFLYYRLRSSDYRHEVLASATGSTVRHTSPSRICNFRFALPPLHEQRAIAHVLETLDDKIELNRRTGKTLEEMARALYKSWFVDFDPVRAKIEGRRPCGMDSDAASLFPDALEDSELGRIPRTWMPGSIYDLAEVVYGAPFKSKLFNTDGVGVPIVPVRRIASVTDGRVRGEVRRHGTDTARGMGEASRAAA